MPASSSHSPQGTRELNMAKRRAAILSEARNIIASEGFESLKVRDLAQRAGVTTPTIYNLIGGKKDILSLIIKELVERLTEVQSSLDFSDPETAFTTQIERFEALFSSDPPYYRAAFMAGDRSKLFDQHASDGIYARSLRQPINACKAALKKNLLQGAVSAEQLGQQVYACYRLARQDWTLGHIQLAEFKNQALTGIFLTLAADATPAFRKRLIERVNEL